MQVEVFTLAVSFDKNAAIQGGDIMLGPGDEAEVTTKTAAVYQMRLFRRHSLIIIVVMLWVIVKSLHPHKPRFSSFENNMGRTDGRTDGRTKGHY